MADLLVKEAGLALERSQAQVPERSASSSTDLLPQDAGLALESSQEVSGPLAVSLTDPLAQEACLALERSQAQVSELSVSYSADLLAHEPGDPAGRLK